MGIQSDYLDLAIGVAVVFFLTSLVVSGLNEGLQWLLRVRAKFLWAYLYDLVDPKRTKKLPHKLRGILHLWNKKNDPRPLIPDASSGAVRENVIGGNAVVDPEQLISRLAHALDPLDAPQLTPTSTAGPRGTATPAGADPGGAGAAAPTPKGKRTSIQHVPPASLAQAFVEVLSDMGKESLADSLAELAEAQASGASTTVAIERIATEVSRDDLGKGRVTRAFEDFVGAPPSVTTHERATALASALSTIGGVMPPPRLVTTAAELLDDIAARNASTVEPPPDLTRPAREMAGPLARTFPNQFTRQRIDAAIDSLNDSPLGPTTRRLWEGAEGRIDEFRTALEGYFDSEMKRLGGYYRRSIRIVLIILAILVAVVSNVDALSVTRELWRNPEGRATLVGEADDLTATSTGPSQGAGAAPDSTAPRLADLKQKCEQQLPDPDGEFDRQEVASRLNEVRTCVTDALSRASGLDVVDDALWVSPSAWWDRWTPGSARQLGLHIIGVAATVAALVLGAPFWFDLLKRLTGARRGLVGQT